MDKRDLKQVFKKVLGKRCVRCRMRGRKYCSKSVIFCVALALKDERRRVRSTYVRPTHAASVELRFKSFDAYLVGLDEAQFHDYTRLTPAEFSEVHSRIAHRMSHMHTHRAPVSTMHRLAITLRYLGHGSTFVALAQELSLGRTTVSNIVYEGCRAIIEEFWSEAFPTPSRSTWQRSAEQFRSVWRYPRAVGSIDGKHFRCYAPRNTGSAYYNYKGHFSFVLLAVVDGGYRIMALDLGGKGRESDSGLFRTSPLRAFLEASARSFPRGGDLDGQGVVDYHILADGGFAQTTWMQRPFRQAEVANDVFKAHFNECFSSARRIVESVFGIICARFRVFQRSLIGTEDNCKLTVAAALVLHNLLVDRISTQQLLQRYVPVPQFTREPVSRAQSRVEAQIQRMRMVQYFAHRDGLM